MIRRTLRFQQLITVVLSLMVFDCGVLDRRSNSGQNKEGGELNAAGEGTSGPCTCGYANATCIVPNPPGSYDTHIDCVFTAPDGTKKTQGGYGYSTQYDTFKESNRSSCISFCQQYVSSYDCAKCSVPADTTSHCELKCQYNSSVTYQCENEQQTLLEKKTALKNLKTQIAVLKNNLNAYNQYLAGLKQQRRDLLTNYLAAKDATQSYYNALHSWPSLSNYVCWGDPPASWGKIIWDQALNWVPCGDLIKLGQDVCLEVVELREDQHLSATVKGYKELQEELGKKEPSCGKVIGGTGYSCLENTVKESSVAMCEHLVEHGAKTLTAKAALNVAVKGSAGWVKCLSGFNPVSLAIGGVISTLVDAVKAALPCTWKGYVKMLKQDAYDKAKEISDKMRTMLDAQDKLIFEPQVEHDKIDSQLNGPNSPTGYGLIYEEKYYQADVDTAKAAYDACVATNITPNLQKQPKSGDCNGCQTSCKCNDGSCTGGSCPPQQ